MRDLVQYDGVYYKKFSDVPSSGKVTGSFNGSIMNGKRVGTWVEFHDDGQLGNKGNYKNWVKISNWQANHTINLKKDSH